MIDPARLRRALTDSGLSQAELARRSHLSTSAINQLLSGVTKRSRSLPELADALKVNPDWLEGKTDNPSRNFLPRLADEDEILNVPFLKRSSFANSEPIEKSLQAYAFSKDWLKDILEGYDSFPFFFSKMYDASMSPTLNIGDHICVSITDTYDRDPDGIWLLSLAGRSAVRRIRESGLAGYTLIADNPAFAPLSTSISEVALRGKLIWQGRRLASF